MNILQEIKTNLSELLGESTSYGLPKVFKSKRIFFKLFWLAFMLVGGILSIYFTVESFNNYFKYEKILKTEIINENPMIFPTITFCSSSNQFNKSIQDIIKVCSFNNENEGCIENFQTFESKSVNFKSNCLQFNSGKNHPILNSTVPKDWDYGLVLSFRTSQSLEISIYIDDPTSISFINGKQYKINDNKLQYEPNNFDYELVLSKIVSNKLGSPYNTCFKDTSEYEFDLNKTIIDYLEFNKVSYNQEYCHNLCPQLEYINTNPCSCTNTSLGNVEIDCFFLQKNEKIKNCTLNYFRKYSMLIIT